MNEAISNKLTKVMKWKAQSFLKTLMLRDTRVIVIDAGAATCKVGFAGNDMPHSVFASAVGRPKQFK